MLYIISHFACEDKFYKTCELTTKFVKLQKIHMKIIYKKIDNIYKIWYAYKKIPLISTNIGE